MNDLHFFGPEQERHRSFRRTKQGIDQSEERQMTDLKITKGSANVFEDLGFDVQESQNLLLRSQTMVALVQWFNASGLTQVVAAKTLGVTQPRLNQLLKGKIEIFSLDALVNLATSAGMRVGHSVNTTLAGMFVPMVSAQLAA